MGLIEYVKSFLYGGDTAWNLASTPQAKNIQVVGEWKSSSIQDYMQKVGIQKLAEPPPVDTYTLQSIYRRNELVYACIMKIAEASQDPLLVVQEKNREGDWVNVDNHPLTMLLRYPNSDQDESTFNQNLVISEHIAGISYIEIIRKGNPITGIPIGLNILNPNKTKPVVGELPQGGYGIIKYHFKDGDYEVDIPVENMMVKRLYDPLNRFGGLSPLAVAMGSVDSDNAQIDYVRAFFNNAGIPSGILKVKDQSLTQEQSDMIKAQWHIKYSRSAGKQHDIAVLDQNADFVKLGANLNELESDSLSGKTEARICMVFNVPPMLVGAYVGLQHSTYSNMREARAGFWDDKMSPLFKSIARFYNKTLLPQYEPMDRIKAGLIRVSYDYSQVAAMLEDQEAKEARAREHYKTGGITLNEFRAIIGEKPDTQGDYYMRGKDTVYVYMDTIPPQPVTPITAKDNPPVYMLKSDTRGNILDVKPIYLPVSKTSKNTEIVLSLKAKSLKSSQKDMERDVKQFLQKEYEAVADYVEAAFKTGLKEIETKDTGDSTEYGVNWEQEAKDFQDLMLKYYPVVLEDSYSDAEITIGNTAIDFNLENQYVQGILDTLAHDVKNVPETTRQAIREIIGKQAAEGLTIPEVAKLLRDAGVTESKSRAKAIAVTETAKAYSAGSMQAYMDSGVVEKTEWLVTNPCPICEELGGKQVELNAEFKAGVKYPPAHPSCKCAIAPIVKAD